MSILQKLSEIAARHCPQEGSIETVLQGLHFYRSSHPRQLTCGVTGPTLGVILQGSKTVYLGQRSWTYEEGRFLLISASLPIHSRTAEATKERPYLGMSVTLESAEILGVANEASIALDQTKEYPALSIERLEPALEEALFRLARLVDSPEDAPTLGSLVRKEIIYLLLRGPQAPALKRLAAGETHNSALGAVRWLRENFHQPLRIEELATELNVSPSGLHHQFKSLTSTSPLQYQKLLRLQEARRLLLDGSESAASISYKVGYNSPSQFSREYKRLFGAPPRADLERIRGL